MDCYGDHEENELVETCISNMLFDYKLNFKNLCITQFADPLQRTKRTPLIMRTKRLLVPQAMTVLISEKRKRLEGKVVEEPPVIPCTAEELNHVLDEWIGDRMLGHSLYPDHLLRKKERILCFVEFIIMSSTLLRIVGPFVGFFTRSLGRGP